MTQRNQPLGKSDFLWAMSGADWPRYCQHCGTSLVHTTRLRGYFDVRTGLAIYDETLVCPYRWKFWQSHDLWRNRGTDTNEWVREGYGEL